MLFSPPAFNEIVDNNESQSCTFLTELSPIPFAGLSVSLSGMCIVAKWLIGSGCRLGWWVRSVEGWVCYMDVEIIKEVGANLGLNVHCNQWGLCCMVV